MQLIRKNIEKFPVKAVSENIDMPIWNQFQTGISDLLDISIGIFDNNGYPICLPHKEDPISEFMRKQTGRGADLYRDSYKKAIARALQSDVPYIYKCYSNQYIFAVPFALNSNTFMSIIGGHVYISENDFNVFMKKTSNLSLDEVALQGLKKKIKIIQPDIFFTIPSAVKSLAVPFLKSLYSSGYYEKKYYQINSIIEAGAPAQLSGGDTDDIYRHIFNALAVLFDVETASSFVGWHRPPLMKTSLKGYWDMFYTSMLILREI